MAAEQPPTRDEFPYKLTLHIPFPTPHLATTALKALSVDAELSPLVRRSFSIAQSPTDGSGPAATPSRAHVLEVRYSATTNRMLRVAVNGFFESVGVVVGVMRELDTDVVDRDMDGEGSLAGVQGLAPVERVEKLPGVEEVEVKG